jgi:glycine oxidase
MTDCLIVGGGIIGMLTAKELLDAGMSVTVLDSGPLGQESSWAGGGIISPLYPWRHPDALNQLAQWSQKAYPGLVQQLRFASRIDPEYTTSGLLILAPKDQDRARRWSEQYHPSLSFINPKEITIREPALKTSVDEAIWMPHVAQIRNPRLVKSLHQSIAGRANIYQHTEVTDLWRVRDRLLGVITKQGPIEAERVVICAGSWTGKLLKGLKHPPAIEPVLGQMIVFRHKPGRIKRITLHQDRYIIPRQDGRVLVGSTLEHCGFEKTTTDAAKQELYAFATSHFPELASALVEHHWAGLRPGSPNGIPYIGAVPEIPGLYLNAGHFRNGVVLGPASCRLLANIILEHSPILPIAAYRLTADRLYY